MIELLYHSNHISINILVEFGMKNLKRSLDLKSVVQLLELLDLVALDKQLLVKYQDFNQLKLFTLATMKRKKERKSMQSLCHLMNF